MATTRFQRRHGAGNAADHACRSGRRPSRRLSCRCARRGQCSSLALRPRSARPSGIDDTFYEGRSCQASSAPWSSKHNAPERPFTSQRAAEAAAREVAQARASAATVIESVRTCSSVSSLGARARVAATAAASNTTLGPLRSSWPVTSWADEDLLVEPPSIRVALGHHLLRHTSSDVGDCRGASLPLRSRARWRAPAVSRATRTSSGRGRPCDRHQARTSAPSGISFVIRNRQSAISSLRASATIPMRRARRCWPKWA